MNAMNAEFGGVCRPGARLRLFLLIPRRSRHSPRLRRLIYETRPNETALQMFTHLPALSVYTRAVTIFKLHPR